jgi:hypothetical protein
MRRQEELAFIKALGSIEPSTIFLRELRKAVGAGKKRKALVAVKANARSSPAPERQSEASGGAWSSRASPQLLVSKRKADELSSSDCPSEPASRRHAPGHLFVDGPEAQDTTGELAAQGSRQLGPTEGGLAYAAVLAGVASPHQPSGTHKSEAKGSASAEPAASPEVAPRRMSLVYMSGPLCGTPDGTTSYAQVASNSVAPAAERHNKNPIYVTGITDVRGFPAWLRAKCKSGLYAQIKGRS